MLSALKISSSDKQKVEQLEWTHGGVFASSGLGRPSVVLDSDDDEEESTSKKEDEAALKLLVEGAVPKRKAQSLDDDDNVRFVT